MKQNIYDDPEFFRGYHHLRETGSGLNEDIEEPAVRDLLPNPHGLRILDLGCGSGRLCRHLARQGARSVLGVDISERMLEQARLETTDSNDVIEYRNLPVEELTLDPNSFDLIVSSLVLYYIKDLDTVFRNAAAWLDAGGVLIFSMEHPIMTALPEQDWIRDPDGNTLHWPIDRYHEEGIRHIHWFVDNVIKYHRSVSSIANAVIDAGLNICRLVEPYADAEALRQRPELAEQSRRPPFLVIRATKP